MANNSEPQAAVTATPEATLDTVVIGNIGIDTNVYLTEPLVDLGREGYFTQNLDCIGQAGGYASFGYTRLGLRTGFIGHVGDDVNGRFIRAELDAAGIDTSALFVDPAGTARSANLMAPDGTRRSFYDGKSHMTLRPDMDICRAVLARARVAHFNIPNWGRLLLPMARELGLTVVVDLQDAVRPDDPYRRDFIQHADIVFFSVAAVGSPERFMEALLAERPELIVIAGMGAAGCAVGTSAEGVRRYPAVELDVPVVDTNGAGDSLAVGFVASYVLGGYSLEESVRRGQIMARYTCTLKSSWALCTRAQLDAYAARQG